jgi:hypothetical protein
MARMMRAIRWQIETPTFGYDPKGSWRASEKRAMQSEIDDAWDDLLEAENLSSLWCLLYRTRSAERADSFLDIEGLPKPPSRERRMPG